MAGIAAFVALFAAPLPGMARPEFRCDVGDYFGLVDHMERLLDARDYEGFTLSAKGSELVHKRMREAVADPEIDPDRTPIVMGDYEDGAVMVVYCPGQICTPLDAVRALRICNRALDARICAPFAIRVDGDLLCVSAPRP